MNTVGDSGEDLPDIKSDGRLYVYLSRNHFQQNKVIIPNNDNVINIYCVYEIQPISSSRDTTFTIQNALFGAMQLTKDATDNSKNNYKGYGICFDERSQFGHTITEDGRAHTTNGRNVLIFGVDMSFSVHVTNSTNSIYVMGDGVTQVIHDTTFYVEENYWRNFTDNVLVNKCSGSCDTINNPMAKLCVPNIIKRINMKVYNFLMMLNETCSVLWHEICKCICKLNLSVCNNKQMWNSDTCRCDCHEDFNSIINCTKGYTWNPSTCECQCDMWYKPG